MILIYQIQFPKKSHSLQLFLALEPTVKISICAMECYCPSILLSFYIHVPIIYEDLLKFWEDFWHYFKLTDDGQTDTQTSELLTPDRLIDWFDSVLRRIGNIYLIMTTDG